MRWIEESPSHEMVLGTTYRLTLWLRLPDTIEMRTKIRNAILAWDRWFDRLPTAAKNLLGGLDIKTVETGLASSSNVVGRLSPWPLRITFKKVSGNTPFLVVAAAIAALLLIVIGAVVIVGKEFERSADDLKDTIFNPGFLLAGLVGIALVTGRRR